MPDIILHHYPQSPVAEKVRVGLGIKGLAWRSVEIPRLPPKPDLMPLTGGYRRTPVLQVGADIYCDSQAILRALDQLHPEPSFFPGGSAGMAWGISRWTDGELLDLTVRIVLGHAAQDLPKDFAEDRGRLYFGPDHDLAALQGDLPHVIAQLRAELGWLDQRIATGRRFLLGDRAGLPDCLLYYIVWFLRGRWSDGPTFLAQFPALEAWESRVRALGHGDASEMDSADALAVARDAVPETPEAVAPGEPQALTPGQPVAVLPLGDGGDPAVLGTVRFADRDSIAVLRQDERVGAVCVHFPRAGYRVTAA